MAIRTILCRSLATLAVAAAAIAAGAQSVDDRYALGAGHYAAGRWKLAAEEFRSLVAAGDAAGHDEDARFFLGETLLQLGDYAAAEKAFADYRGRYTDGRHAKAALFRQGEAAHLGGSPARAEPLLAALVERWPDDPLAAYAGPYLASIVLAAGKALAAEQQFRATLDRFPAGPRADECRLGLARALEKNGRSEEAERIYLALAGKAASPLADDAQLALGGLHYAAGKFEEALGDFQALADRWPQSPLVVDAALGRGWALFKLQRFDESAAALAPLADDPQRGATAAYWAGMARRAAGDLAAAAKLLHEAAARRPDGKLTAAMRLYAGDCLLRLGDAKAADEEFKKVISGEWADEAARGRIQAAVQLRRFDDVVRQAERFAIDHPQSPLVPAVETLNARALLELGRHAEAVKRLEVLSPSLAAGEKAEALYLLAVGYRGVRRPDAAIAAVLPAMDLADKVLRPRAEALHGSLLMALGRYDEAVAPLEASLKAGLGGVERTRAQAELAVCHARAGRSNEAKRLLAEVAGNGDRAVVAAAELQVAEAALEVGDVAWATELFAGAQADGEGKSRRLAGLGWAHFKAERWDEAARAFGELLEQKPPAALAAEASYARGQAFERLERLDAALAMYQAAIDAAPAEASKALLAAGRLHARLRQYGEAAARFERFASAFTNHPDRPAALYEHAWAMEDWGKRAESNRLLERLRTDHPKSPLAADATYRLASRAYDAGEWAAAARLCDALLRGEPAVELRRHGLYLQGQVAAAERRWADVERAFTALRAESPPKDLAAMADYWLAEAAFRREDFAAAAERFDRLAAALADPRPAWAAIVDLRRAQMLAHRQRWDEAFALAGTIQKQHPDFQQQYEVDYLLGRCLADRAEFDAARAAYRRAVDSAHGRKTETAAMAQWMIGESHFHQQQYEAALREYLKVEILYAYPAWRAAALLQAGKCYEKLAQDGEAARLYRRLVEQYADTPFTAEGRARLAAVEAKQPMANNNPRSGAKAGHTLSTDD